MSGWDYETFPNNGPILKRKSEKLLKKIRTSTFQHIAACHDTREHHYFLFNELTPPDHPYFAGHYRGEDFEHLRDYGVCVGGDPRVGVEPHVVAEALDYLKKIMDAFFDHASRMNQNQSLTAPQQLALLVRGACLLFVEFLRIHPYANGNGHIGRFLIFCILGKFGIWPRKWPLDDRPPDPPYSYLIKLYRDGTQEPLEQFVLRCVIG